MNIEHILTTSPLILTECAISERLRRNADIELHPTLFNTPLIYDETGAARLKKIYSQYREIARNARLPILLCAPTWRVDKNRIEEAGFDKPLNRDAVHFMRKLQRTWQDMHSPLLIGGLIGPKNDCYSPDLALSQEEAKDYHQWQIDELEGAGVDCIIAQTIPAVSEGAGIADALSDSTIPYILSFVINRKAEVLDGTPLLEAIQFIDKRVSRPPLGYMVNCAYPTFICADAQPTELFQRLIGIQANSSAKDHDQLDGAATLQQEDLSHWGDNMLRLNKDFGMKILGGCCGTDDTYLQYLVDH
jgi:homocysteine S-methyltransferase